jgi:chromosome segregation ATPase
VALPQTGAENDVSPTWQLLLAVLGSTVLVKLLDLADKYVERRRTEKAKTRVDELMTAGETRKLNLEEVTFVLKVYKETIEGLKVDVQGLKDENRQLHTDNEKCEERCAHLEQQVRDLQKVG